MKGSVIEVRQNTKDWREWRNKGLGASDAPIVMGESPWTSRFELWAYKTGFLTRSEPNSFQVAAMQRGHDLEPEARRLYEQMVGQKYPATSFEHSDYPYLRASLDGYNAELNKNLEIKCPGKIDHATAKSGKVPNKYYPQLQMQMLVSGALLTDYFSWDGKESMVLLPVVANIEYQKQLLLEMQSFWYLVQTKTPPKIEIDEIGRIVSVVRNDLDKVNQSFKVLALVCEAITKGESK